MAKSKKGAEMTVGTIVIIVLALIVLVVLVLGFTGGWGNLWGRITSFFGGANVDSIVQACQVACTTNAKYDYCDRNRTVKTEGIDGKIVTEKKKCVDLEKEVKYGLEKCEELQCGQSGGNGDALAAKCRAISTPSDCVDDCRIDDTGTCVPDIY